MKVCLLLDFGGMVYNLVIVTPPTELNESLPICTETQNKLHFQLTNRLYRGTDGTSSLISQTCLKGHLYVTNHCL